MSTAEQRTEAVVIEPRDGSADQARTGLVWSAVPGRRAEIRAEWVDAPGPYRLYWDDWLCDDVRTPGSGPVSHEYARVGVYHPIARLQSNEDVNAMAEVVIRPELSPQAQLDDLGGGRVRLRLRGWTAAVRHRVDWGDGSPAQDVPGSQLQPGHTYRGLDRAPTITVTDVPAGRSITIAGPAPALGLSAHFAKTASWDSGYSGELHLENGTKRAAWGWRLEFALPAPARIADTWPSVVRLHQLGGGQYALSSKVRLEPGKATKVGIRVEPAGTPHLLPTGFRVTTT